MSVYDKGFDLIIDKALNILFSKNVDIYTFSFYYDHESHALMVLADTKSNSRHQLLDTRKFTHGEFMKAIEAKDLTKASQWISLGERNISLGSFKYRSLGWEAATAPKNSAPFFLAMANAVIRNRQKISALSEAPEDLVFLCSTSKSEVGLVWRNIL